MPVACVPVPISSEQLIGEFERRVYGRPFLAVDTETTGFDLRHGCKPYMVTTCSEEYETHVWEWPVNPLTREPGTSPRTLEAVKEHLRGKVLVFHNPQFDVQALFSIGVPVDWSLVEDTLTASHVLDNTGSHGLKDLCIRYLMEPADDVQRLKAAVTESRRIARSLKWDICREGHPHFPGVRFGEKNPLWHQDTWLPRTLTQYYGGKRLSPKAVLADPHEIPEYYESIAREYGLKDAVRTMRLWKLFLRAFQTEGVVNNPPHGLWPVYLARRLTLPALAAMESRGLPLSVHRTKTKLKSYKLTKERLTTSLQKIAGDTELNPNSGPQLAKVIFGPDSVLGQPAQTFTTKARFPDGRRVPATDKAEIVKIYKRYEPNPPDKPQGRRVWEEHPAFQFSKNLLCLKKFEKATGMLESYLHRSVAGPDGFNRLHTRLVLTGTETTRTASWDPNLQNVTKDDDRVLPPSLLEHLYKHLGLSVRPVFGPVPGTIWYACDWISMQLRLFAYVSGEQRLIDAFAAGWDPHDYMAHRIFNLPEDGKPSAGQRTIAKNVNFGFIFGAQEHRIDSTAMQPGLYQELRVMFPNAIQYMEATIRQVRKHGYVYTPGGYRLYVTDEHAGVNYIIQGAEGEIVQLALRLCHRATESGIPLHRPTPTTPALSLRPLMVIHDELIFEAEGTDVDVHRPAVNALSGLMERAGYLYAGYNLPVSVDVIKHLWGQKEPYAKTQTAS